jgi:hypothetical protein
MTSRLSRGQRLILRLASERRLLGVIDKHGWPTRIAILHPADKPLPDEERQIGRVNMRYCIGNGWVQQTKAHAEGRNYLELTDTGRAVFEASKVQSSTTEPEAVAR